MKFSVVYKPTTLFSLKDSNSTNSGAKSLFLPSPYAIKMALLNQVITVGGDIEKLDSKKSKEFNFIRDAKISFYLPEGSSFCVNNSFVKILKPAREGGGFQQTVAFREYIYHSHPMEIIIEVKEEEAKLYLKQYLHKINFFGKRGCFFQFIQYSDIPSKSNVNKFEVNLGVQGILQEYDDFESNSTFETVNNFSSKNSIRVKEILLLPLKNTGSSKAFTCYKIL